MKLQKISAILGPTNTGKTFSAINKLLNYSNGVMGFPLRLLARENYERVKQEIGSNKVALVTGEEKIVPKSAKYFFCTVESIPDYNFDFVGIDEIQLCADYERGHLFSEKLLNRKGSKETIFLGSLSMEKILKKIYPNIQIKKKKRLSKLSYCGYKNLTRLPNRSAIIAFSLIDVYEIANKIKQAHGGVSVVMGALSPDVRNAQVQLFDDGKVDYIVATDAIGLGLNLNIKNIFFSRLKKFDGLRERKLTNDEISQIAGRAGRYLNDGFFGTTGTLKSLDDELVKYVENYQYTEIKNIYWRNSTINFNSHRTLLNSLSLKTEKRYLILKKNAADHRYLRILVNDSFISKKLTNRELIQKLWELCRTPDYSRELDEFHSRFLKKIFSYLVSNQKLIPKAWINEELDSIKKKTKKISELNHKISQIRKWSFLAFKNNWMENGHELRKKIKSIEYQLSVTLHSQLINEFIGEFRSKKSLLEKEEGSLIIMDEKQSIKFGKEKIGSLTGFVFNINHSFKKNNNIFNNKILKKHLIFFSKKKMEDLKKSKFSDFEFKINGDIFWKNSLVAKLFKNNDILKPKIKIFYDEYFTCYKNEIEKVITNCFNYFLSKNLEFIKKIDSIKNPSQNMRAITYSIIENLGHCQKDQIRLYYDFLKPNEIGELKSKGIKLGNFFFFFNLQKTKYFRQILINVFYSNNLESYLEKNFYKVSREKLNKRKINIYRKMGFYLIKISNDYYFVYFEYLEKLIKKKFYYIKKKIKISNYENLLEKNIFKTKSKIIFSN